MLSEYDLTNLVYIRVVSWFCFTIRLFGHSIFPSVVKNLLQALFVV